MINRKDRMVVYKHPRNEDLVGVLCYTEFDIIGDYRKEYISKTDNDCIENNDWFIGFVRNLSRLVSPDIKCYFPQFYRSGNKVKFQVLWSSILDEFSQPTLDFIHYFFDIPSECEITKCC